MNVDNIIRISSASQEIWKEKIIYKHIFMAGTLYLAF